MTEVFSPAQRRVWEEFSASPACTAWYLAGGTALALRHAHRDSEDFDFFRSEPFDPMRLAAQLASYLSGFSVTSASEGTLHARTGGVRVSFLHFAPPLLEAPEERDGVRIARDLDVGAMKLSAIAGRGMRKDFVDLYLLAKEGPGLAALFDAFDRRFADLKVDRAHLLRSLVYFEDAEREPMPRLRRPWRWEEIRSELEAQVRGLLG